MRNGMAKSNGSESKRQAAGYRRMLLDRKAEVLAGLGVRFDTLARMGRIAEEDQAQITHDEFVSVRLNSLDYLQLKLVNEALDRLQTGEYGLCLSCDEPIPTKRLQALPWARYCVGCQDQAGQEDQTEAARK